MNKCIHIAAGYTPQKEEGATVEAFSSTELTRSTIGLAAQAVALRQSLDHYTVTPSSDEPGPLPVSSERLWHANEPKIRS